MLSSKYGPGAPKEIFSGRFTKLTEVSLFNCRLSLSPRFTLDLLPPHATALLLSLPFSLFVHIPRLLYSGPQISRFHLNPTMRQLHYFWYIPHALVPRSCLHEGSWAMLVLISSVFLISVLPDVQGLKIVFQLGDQLCHYQ